MDAKSVWVALVLVPAISGCLVGPNYRTPQAATPAGWSGLRTADTGVGRYTSRFFT